MPWQVYMISWKVLWFWRTASVLTGANRKLRCEDVERKKLDDKKEERGLLEWYNQSGEVGELNERVSLWPHTEQSHLLSPQLNSHIRQAKRASSLSLARSLTSSAPFLSLTLPDLSIHCHRGSLSMWWLSFHPYTAEEWLGKVLEWIHSVTHK